MLELWLAYGFCSIAVVLAVSFVLIKHPVHAALSFACVVLAAAGVYLLQDAAFVAASTVVVYAGATIIIFMFVLMFAQQTNLLDYDTQKQNPIAAAVVAIALAATVIAVALKEFPKLETQLAKKAAVVAIADAAVADGATASSTTPGDVVATSGEPAAEAVKSAESEPVAALGGSEPNALALNDSAAGEAKSDAETVAEPTLEQDRFTVAKLGVAFYTRYLLAIEIAGTLLLVATIGAVVIAQRVPQADAKETTKL